MKECKFLNRAADGLPAIAEKYNDVLTQKIIGEMVELFFTCYLVVMKKYKSIFSNFITKDCGSKLGRGGVK